MATTLKDFVGGDARDTKFITECATDAAAMVETRCKGSDVPASVKARAVLEVGADLYNRKKARNGITGLDSADVSPMRIRSDPMKAAQAILAPYLEPGLA